MQSEPVETKPDPVWGYVVTDQDKNILSEWNTSGEAIREADRVGGRASRIKKT